MGTSMNERRFMTIREVARTGIVTEYYIRSMVKQGKVPGVWSGKSFLVNYPLFVEWLDNECRKNAGMKLKED